MKSLDEFLNRVICGDVLDVLSKLPSSSIDLGITSPPTTKRKSTEAGSSLRLSTKV
ncbi:MAG: hypothetical protein RMK75_03645 [Aquificaceae bacterium]|nr:hypothetical protein [Aquificaceae bacterium]MDW8423399.1 hypothetical protein [Aquificaceae bacterium]